MKRLSEQVIGCAVQVSRILGSGFLEKVYENALAIELHKTGIEYHRQHPMTVQYQSEPVGEYVCDFLVSGKLLVELKALSRLMPEHETQVINYLKATGITVGLLLNFGTPRLGIKRIVLNHSENDLI
jgi:GxxExxY protein